MQKNPYFPYRRRGIKREATLVVKDIKHSLFKFSFAEVSPGNQIHIFCPPPLLGLSINSMLLCTQNVELWPTAEILYLASQLHKLQIDIHEVELFQMYPEIVN